MNKRAFEKHSLKKSLLGRPLFRRIVVISILLSVPILSGSAQNIVACQGKVSQALTYRDGRVMIYGSWRNDWTQICNVKTVWKDVSTEACWNWFALVNEAFSKGDDILVYYSNVPDGMTCETLPTYGSSLSPVYTRRMAAP